MSRKYERLCGRLPRFAALTYTKYACGREALHPPRPYAPYNAVQTQEKPLFSYFLSECRIEKMRDVS